jgi:hypothetical protein
MPAILHGTKRLEMFSDNEISLLVDALHDQLKIKQDAFAAANELQPEHYRFVPADFGIPTLERLIAEFEQ